MPAKYVVLVAEDDLSLAVLHRLIQDCNPGLCLNNVVVARGYGNIKNNSVKYIQASRIIPHIVLTDLDNYDCPHTLLSDWGIERLPETCLFRIAIKEVEAWLLADRVGFARFLNIAVNQIPAYPEQDLDPKHTLLTLAGRSRRRGLARDLLPERGSAATIGTFYNQRLSEFAAVEWDINNASANSDSLNRAIQRISSL